MTMEPDRLALFEEMREEELDSAALYRALAETSEGRRKDVLNRLAEAEERHAGHWERLLREAGVTEVWKVTQAKTADMLADLGHEPVLVDIGEFEKLEGCVTCLSVRLRELYA